MYMIPDGFGPSGREAFNLRRLSPPAIGWGSGAAKREILDPATGAVGSITTG